MTYKKPQSWQRFFLDSMSDPQLEALGMSLLFGVLSYMFIGPKKYKMSKAQVKSQPPTQGTNPTSSADG